MLTWKKLWFRLFLVSLFLHINCLFWYPSGSCLLASTLSCIVVMLSFHTIIPSYHPNTCMHNIFYIYVLYCYTEHSYQSTSHHILSSLTACTAIGSQDWRRIRRISNHGSSDGVIPDDYEGQCCSFWQSRARAIILNFVSLFVLSVVLCGDGGGVGGGRWQIACMMMRSEW